MREPLHDRHRHRLECSEQQMPQKISNRVRLQSSEDSRLLNPTRWDHVSPTYQIQVQSCAAAYLRECRASEHDHGLLMPAQRAALQFQQHPFLEWWLPFLTVQSNWR